MFDAIEGVRQASVAAHRSRDAASAAALTERLGRLDLGDTLRFVRGFLLFSLLANLAEDRGRPEAASAATLAGAIDRLAGAGVDRAAVVALLDQGAHRPGADRPPHRSPPQEHDRPRSQHHGAAGGVQRRRIATPATEAELIRQITILWQTRPLRAVKPVVAR